MSGGVIAFGDVHGCHKAAERAVLLASELGAQAIFLGDYVDRGPSAIATLRVLMKAQEQHPNWIFLRGNHDQMLLDLIEGRAQATDIGEVLGMNFEYAQAGRSLQEWQEASVPEQESIVRFLHSTPFYHETELFIFCHAVLRDTGQPMEEKSSEELMWNYSYLPSWQGKTFVHGHLPVDDPGINGNGVNVNTSCGYGGMLTGLHISKHGEPLCFFSISEDGERVSRRAFRIPSPRNN